jgi:predicted TIM-barrel fold metal-dependent hydrolase
LDQRSDGVSLVGGDFESEVFQMSVEKQINAIKIIDGHVHAVDPWYWLKYVGSFPFADVASDLPPMGLLQMKNKKQVILRGFQEIYGFPHPALTDENRAEMEMIYKESQDDEAAYFMKAMDLAGIESAIEICLSAPVLPPGLNPSRFAKAQLVDGFLIPLDNSDIEGNKRVKEFVKMVEVYPKILHKENNDNIKTFDEYLSFVSDALRTLAEQGVAALKMNTAYWRELSVDIVEKDEAEDVWNKKDTKPERYKKLQDYIMRRLIAEAAILDLPIHIHTGPLGITRPIEEANPAKLDPFLWLPDIKPAKIVLLHGGYPYCREAGFMAGRTGDAPNCYLDFSMMTFFLPGSPDSIKDIIKMWIVDGLAEKLLYGSDGNNVLGAWMSAVNARHLLTVVLDELIAEGFLDESQAIHIATLILRGNVKKLYRNKI